MDNSNLSTRETSIRVLMAITAIETTLANLTENVKKLDSRLDNHTSSDGNLRSEFATFKAQHELQLSQLNQALGQIKEHLEEHCEEIEGKASTSIDTKLLAVIDRVIAIEQELAKEKVERKAKEEAERKAKEDEKERYQKAMDAFTKRNSVINTIQQFATLIAGFFIAKYFTK